MNWKRIFWFLFPSPVLRQTDKEGESLGVVTGSSTSFTFEQLQLIKSIELHMSRHLAKKAKSFVGYAIANGLDYRTMNRGFLYLFGRSFRNQRRFLRVQQAKTLLLAHDIELTAGILGYFQVSVFERDFFKMEQVTPQQYLSNQTPPA